jgi:hypothetical protein
MRPFLKKPFTKIGLLGWFKVKALSSSPSTTKKKMKERKEGRKKEKKKKRKKGFMEVRQCILVGVFVSWLLPYWGWSLGPLAC